MRWIMGLLFAACGPLWAITPSQVLIVANDKVEGSVEIAEYYAAARGIPIEQILKISASDKEEITREEFNKDIWEPVKKAVAANDNILAIVPTRGVPLKVKETDTSNDANIANGFIPGRDFGSVDGELALLRHGEYSIEGAVQNPWLNSSKRLTFEDNILVVCRLDGATVEIAKGLVEKALIAEALGANGESFLDTRGDNLQGGYLQRDVQMRLVGDAWKAGNLPYHHDTEPAVLDLSTRESLHYYGWYAGTQKPAGTVKFRTGGICIHLHSFAGATVRGSGNWVGPLLQWNTTATYGTVYEPLTVGFPHEHIFWDRLVKGWSFGEAGQVANQLLSWQAVFVGDPLYTPYAEGYAALHDEYRAAVLARLSTEEPVEIDEARLPLTNTVINLLRARADQIAELTRKDIKEALAAFDDLRFLLSGMQLDSWLGELAKPFDRELQSRFDVIKKGLKDDLTATGEFEKALGEWKGLPIYTELEAYKEELTESQEKIASKHAKKARSDADRKRWFKAWLEAAQAAEYKFAPSAVEAKAVMDEIMANAEAVTKMKADADKELASSVEKAQKEFDKNRFERAQKALGTEWRYYPDCDQRTAAKALSDKIEAELTKDN
jgi:uncharacterized protein (TIGR03790 family)